MAGIESLSLVEAKNKPVGMPRAIINANLHLYVVKTHEIAVYLLEEVIHIGLQLRRCDHRHGHPIDSPKLKSTPGVQFLKVHHSV